MTGGWNRVRWTRATLTSCARRNSTGAPAPRRCGPAASSVPAAGPAGGGPLAFAGSGAAAGSQAAWPRLAPRVGAGGARVVPLGAAHAGQRAARIFARLEQVQHPAEVVDR